MSEAQESVNPVDSATQQPVAVPSEILDELERLRQHNQALAKEQSNYREERRLAEERAVKAEHATRKAKSRSLELDPDDALRLERFDGLQGRVDELETQLKQRDTAVRQERLKSAAMQTFSQKGALNGEHLYELKKNDLVLRDDGSVAALDGGVERSLDQFVEGLKAPGSPWAYQFQSSGARGMSAVGSQPSATEGVQNPYESGDFAAVVALESGTPEEQALAARFKSQAGKK